MKEMLSKAFDRKQTTQNFSRKYQKFIKSKKTVFEPKHLWECYDGTEVIPLSHTAKVGFKGQYHMFGLSIFSTQNKTEK